MNAAQVRAKARVAMGRREEEVEQEEIEGGELNLVPYLDIVTNLMLFILASVSAGFILGQINTTIPDSAPASSIAPADPKVPPDQQSLQLVASVTKVDIQVWSITGLEGTLAAPIARIPRVKAQSANEPPRYDYAALNQVLYDIAQKRYAGKPRALETYEIILQVDPTIPYSTVVTVMDAVRMRIPRDWDATKKLPVGTIPTPPDPDKNVVGDPYDPDKHLLFPDILFGKWSFQ